MATDQFIIIPVGLLSLAEYLSRFGYKTRIVNLGAAMQGNSQFDVERYISGVDADVYGVDLHWCVHSHGAIEIARICKKYHPNSLVILGGLTATRFHDEIMKEYPFVGAVVRGEGEKPTLQIAENISKNGNLEDVKNLTYRTSEGKIRINPRTIPSRTIDDFNFTRLDLVEPRNTVGWWNIPVCRGCTFNCATCGGSAYSYRKLFGMDKPAFRSPEKIVEDLHLLSQQGAKQVFLFQDVRMGGKKYAKKLIEMLSKVDSLDSLSMELFTPASSEFLDDLSKLKVPLSLSISPESGDENVRRHHGRYYSNSALLRTVEKCRNRRMRLGVFFMVALGFDDAASIQNTMDLYELVFRIDRLHRDDGKEAEYPSPLWSKPEIGPMVLLDPGSLAFDDPQRYGYRLVFEGIQDYYGGLSRPSWDQWVSYETRNYARKEIARIILELIGYNIDMEEKYGLYEMDLGKMQLDCERFINSLDHLVIDELGGPAGHVRNEGMLSQVHNVMKRLGPNSITSTDWEEYGPTVYKIIHESTGLMSGSA
jgi:B12-binding domain/radical SAM domain protein